MIHASSLPRSPPRPNLSRPLRPARELPRSGVLSAPASTRPMRAHVHRPPTPPPTAVVGPGCAPEGRLRAIEGQLFCSSGGTTTAPTTRPCAKRLLGQLKAALPSTGGCSLQGAMVAYATMTSKGDIIERAGRFVGPTALIGVELRHHCHLTMKGVSGPNHRSLQGVPAHRVVERGRGLLDLVLATLRGKVMKPGMSV